MVAAVRFARERDLLVSVLGGGHNVAGLAVCDGGLMIDLSPMTGIHIPATGRQVTVPGIHLMRYADGKMIEHWSNSDDLGMLRQLGVIPPLGP